MIPTEISACDQIPPLALVYDASLILARPTTKVRMMPKTHTIPPSAKIPTTCTLRVVVMCKAQTSFIGSARIATSVTTFAIAKVVKAAEVDMQVPETVGVQSLLRGVHWRKTTRTKARLYIKTRIAISIDRIASDLDVNMRW